MIRPFFRSEMFLLCGMAFFLPLAEAPKNILLFLLLIFWLTNSVRNQNFGTTPLGVELPLACIVALSWVSALFAPFDARWAIFLNTIDFLTIAGLALILARSRLTNKQLWWIVAFVVVGVLAALLEGHLRGGRFPSLKSVGHINQAAIYLCLVTVVALASVIASTIFRRGVMTTFFFLMCLYLTVKTDSRNAIYAIALTTMVIILVLAVFKRSRQILLVCGGIALVAGATLFVRPAFIEKQVNYFAQSHSIIDQERLRLWSGAIKVAAERPILGYGVGTFGSAHSEQNIRKIVERSGGIYQAGDYLLTDHAHNLSLNWLVERGLLALILLYLWLFLIARLSLKSMRENRKIQFWPLAVFSVTAASFFCGLGNTSWHHEHGLLASLFISLGISKISISTSLCDQRRV